MECDSPLTSAQKCVSGTYVHTVQSLNRVTFLGTSVPKVAVFSFLGAAVKKGVICSCPRHEGMQGEVRHGSIHSEPRHWMEMSG
jgi:hypothetical protein